MPLNSNDHEDILNGQSYRVNLKKHADKLTNRYLPVKTSTYMARWPLRHAALPDTYGLQIVTKTKHW